MTNFARTIWRNGTFAIILASAIAIGCSSEQGSEGPGAEDGGGDQDSQSMNDSAGGASGDAGAMVEIRGLAMAIPESWQQEPPDNEFRLAQYRVPGAEDAGDGTFTIFQFGRTQGGSLEDNLQRWTQQFTDGAGGPVRPTIDQFEVGAMHITTHEASGMFSGGMGSPPQENYTVINAMVGTPGGSFFPKLAGPSATIAQHRDAFIAMLRALEWRGG